MRTDSESPTRGRPCRLGREDLLCGAALTLLVLAFFAPAVVGGESFYFRDLLFNHIPRRLAALELLHRGELPLWNPYVNLGEPFLANPNNLLLHPSGLAFLVLPVHAAVRVAVVGQVLLAALALYALLRRWQVRPLAALVVSSGFALSGPLLSLGCFMNGLSSAAPAALALLAADVAARGSRRVGTLLLGAVWALQATGGEPVVALATAALSAGYLVVMTPGESWRGRLRGGALRLGAAVAWAGGMSALQLLPTLDLVGSTARGEGLAAAEMSAWSLHPASLLESLAPGLYGEATMAGTPAYWGQALHHRGMPYILSVGLAAPVLVLAAVGVLVRDRRSRFLSGAGLGFLVLALGRFTPLLGLVMATVPWAAVARYPVKLFYVTGLCLAGLAGLGLEALLSGRRPAALTWVMPSTAAALGFALVGACLVPQAPKLGDLAWPVGAAAGALGLSVMSTALLGRGGRSDRVVLLVLLGVTVVQLWPAHRGLNPTASVERLSGTPDVVSTLKSDPDLARVQRRSTPGGLGLASPERGTPLPNHLLNRDSLHPNVGLMWGLTYGLNATTDGLDWPAARLFGSFAESLPFADRVRMLGIARVSHLLSFDPLPGGIVEPAANLEVGADRPLGVFRNPALLPRAMVVGQAARRDDLAQACRDLARRDFDPRRTVILSGAEPGAGGAGPTSTCRVVEDRSDHVVLEVEADGDGWLVLLDAFAPGWHAAVDGRRVEILRADVCFRAVAVTHGSHTVVFRYLPWSVAAGAVLTALTALAALWVVIGDRRRAGR